MTYLIDLHRLWEGIPADTSKNANLLLQGTGRISVVLVAKGQYDLLESLKTVIFQPFLREVIVVDMGLSTLVRKSLEDFIKEHSRCHVITGREQKGLAHAYNLGSHYCTGDYVLFMTEKGLLRKNTLVRLLSLVKQKTPPYIIGLTPKVLPINRGQSRDHWLGKLMHFQNITNPTLKDQKDTLTHVASVKAEGFFVSLRSFSMLKGLDENYFNEVVLWDFCLRTHYAGGNVFQANHLLIDYQSSVAGMNWLKHLRAQWRNYRGWRYFYQKYVSGKTHFITRLRDHAFFLFQFMWDSLLSKPLNKPR